MGVKLYIKGEDIMAIPCSPYHSVDSDVYHIYSDCSKGNDIEKDKKRQCKDIGKKKLCQFCKDIKAGIRKR